MGAPHNLSRPAEVADVLFFGLLLAAIPFVLPIASWVAARRTRSRVEELSRIVTDQQTAIDRLSGLVGELRREAREGGAPADRFRASPGDRS